MSDCLKIQHHTLPDPDETASAALEPLRLLKRERSMMNCLFFNVDSNVDAGGGYCLWKGIFDSNLIPWTNDWFWEGIGYQGYCRSLLG